MTNCYIDWTNPMYQNFVNKEFHHIKIDWKWKHVEYLAMFKQQRSHPWQINHTKVKRNHINQITKLVFIKALKWMNKNEGILDSSKLVIVL